MIKKYEMMKAVFEFDVGVPAVKCVTKHPQLPKSV